MPKHLTTDDSSDFVQTSQVGAANGVPPLDSGSKIPATFLPASTAPVTSVNAQTGDVVVSPNSIGAVPNSSVNAANGVAPLDGTGRLPVAKLPTTAVQTVNGYAGPSVTLTAGDFGAISQVTGDGRYMRQDSIVYNAKEHGAVINGTTDDAPAINSILSTSPAGSVVLLPPGDVAINSPIVVPPGKTLMGMHSNLMKVTGLYDPVTRIKPLATFTGVAAILFVDQATGGYASISAEQRLINIMIYGGSAPAAVDGIQAKGNIQNVVMHGVTVRDMTGNGIFTGSNAGVYPYSWRLHRVMLDNNHGHGMSCQLMTDLTMIDCQAIGNWSNGFLINNAANSQLVACRAEWNGNHGYYLTGSWGTGTGSGGLQMSGCGTDRNGFNGVFIDATGNAPLVISNLMTRRDGRNGNTGGGGYAGVNINAATTPVTIGDWTNYPGTDDDGNGTNSPQYGGSVTGSTHVQINNAYLHANTAGFNDGGSNTTLQLGTNITYATGLTSAPVRTVNQPYVLRTGSTMSGQLFLENLTGQGGFFKSWATSGAHALTAYMAATTGTSNSAFNAVSDNVGMSAVQVSGKETDKGTVKVTHANYSGSAGGDGGAAALSVDLQYGTGGGTAAQGLFMTATNGPTTGNMVTIRNNAREDFVLKGSGRAALGIPIGNTPGGKLEIAQNDDSTIGLYLKANSGSAQQLVMLQDSGGNARFEVAANGSSVHRAAAFFTSVIQLGSTSTDVGGVSGVAIGMKNVTTAPTTNPTGGIILYADGGVGKIRQSNGTVITIGSGGGGSALGVAGYRYVVSNGASATEKARADYQCDGTADEVQINQAIADAKAEGGGRILLSPGGFNLAAAISISGTKDENDARTITLQGCGQQVTELNVAANTVGITITDWAQVNIADLGILISGSGTGIQSIGTEDTGNNNTNAFWHSSFRNIRINGGFVATDTTWGMNLDMPWRSVFENIEVEGCRNGIKITNESTMQNAGDCVFSRIFVEIVGTGGYGLYFDSIDGNMNQNEWVMFEAGANSTGCTGIYLGGTVGTASQRFHGLNLEQFQTGINVANGESNEFFCNYVTCDSGQAGNKMFVTGTNSYNNTFQAKWVNVESSGSLKVIEDANTTSNCPNFFEKIRIENNTSGTVTYSTTSSTVLRDITTFNTGNVMPAGLLQYPLTTVNSVEFTPQDHGFVTWTANPGTMSGSGFQLAAGTVYLSKIKIVERSTVVSNITYYVSTAGTSLTAGQCFVGLYNSSGTRLALSADQATNLASTGAKTAALTAAQTLAVGTYYVAFLANFSGTVPNISGSAGNSGVTNVGLTTATSRSLNTAAGNTALPSSITLGSQTANIAVRWAGLN